MPNHISNILTIEGDAKRVAQIKSDIISVDEDRNIRHIDFNKIVPMPESLNITSGSSTSNGIAILEYRAGNATKINEIMGYAWATEFATPEDLINHMIEKGTANLEEAQKALDNGRLYGHLDWYSWSNANWGTKWNAYDTNENENGDIYFQTAWSNPLPVMEALSRKYPDVVFRVRFADEDFGHNVGEYSLGNGEVVSENIPEGGSKEAYDLAADIKGYESYLTDRVYDIKAETIDELEDYEKTYIKSVYNKGVIEDFPRVVIDYMLELAVADEDFELAIKLRNMTACKDED
jgi:hypothetical protein